MIDGMVLAAIETVKRLPLAVAKHFNVYDYMIGDAHVDVSPARRIEIWRRLADRLKISLDAVMGDVELSGGADLGQRDATRGERLKEICGQLVEAFSQRGNIEDLVKQLERQTEGTPAAGDARELRRHLSMKRIPNYSRWRADMFALIAHAERIADELHHKAAR